VAVGLTALAAAAGAGCGGDESGGSEGSAGKTLTVYSSLPLQGASRNQSVAIRNGMDLALEEANGRAGQFEVRHESLDDSTAQAGTWTPEATSANARRAIQDDTTIAYLGEYNSGASAISMPFLNEAQILQNGLTNTAVGLTEKAPGADKGEPEKYYPAGERHYVRIVPNDQIQGAALASVMQQEGCRAVFVANDKEVFGAGLARATETAAKRTGLNIVENTGIDVKAPNYRSLAAGAKSEGADCVAFSGVTANNAVQFFKDFGAALPDAKLFGPDGIAESAFTDPGEGGVPPDVADRTWITIAVLPPDQYPPQAKRFFDDYAAEYGERKPDPYAIYGYEAMSLTIDAIEQASKQVGADASMETLRKAVIDAAFATKGRESVLGTYDIDNNGDTTLTDYGVYRIEDGELAFDRVIKSGT
jgi:branched-chain amino acid transport system substrate-binding protein